MAFLAEKRGAAAMARPDKADPEVQRMPRTDTNVVCANKPFQQKNRERWGGGGGG